MFSSKIPCHLLPLSPRQDRAICTDMAGDRKLLRPCEGADSVQALWPPKRLLVSEVRTHNDLVDCKGHTSTSGQSEGHSCPKHHTLVTQHILPSPTGSSSGPRLFRPHPDPTTSQADALTSCLLMLTHPHLQKDRARPEGEGLSAAPRMGSGSGRRKGIGPFGLPL